MAPTPASLECEIILVEDNPHDAELTMRVLRSGNAALRLAWVRDGVEALELLLGAGNGAGRASRIVLLDLKLPRLDGHEVLKRLKADPRTRSIPVIVLTSSGERSDLVRAYGEGANSYVVKPVGFERFRETVGNIGAYWIGVNQPVPMDAAG